MSRIIKLTESQLRDVVQKAINEQNAGAVAEQIYHEINLAVNGPDTKEDQLVRAIQKITTLQLYNAVNGKFKAVPGGQGDYTSILTILNGELGSGDYNVSVQIQQALSKIGKRITFQRNNDSVVPGTFKLLASAVPKPVPAPVDPKKINYRLCKGFPLMYGCKQTEVGSLQQCLGLKVDYSFGPATLEGLVNYAPMKNGSTPDGLRKQYSTIGLSVQEYNLIRTKYCKVKPKAKVKKPAPVVDTRDKTAPATLASKQIQQLPVNIDLPTLEALPSTGVDPARKAAILGQIKDRGFDKVYKGQPLTPEEKQWLESYLGTQINKDKMKAGGQEKLRLPNT